MNDDRLDWTPISVAGPLPRQVVMTLVQLIGSAWPDAVIDERARPRRALTMLVYLNAAPHPVSVEAATRIRLRSDGSVDEGSLPRDLLAHLGSLASRVVGALPDEADYLEWEVHAPGAGVDGEEDESFIVSVARSASQTSHACRVRAEQELAELKEQLRALRGV